MSTVIVAINIEPIRCGECGQRFGLEDRFIKNRREDGRTWYCPNGHQRVYREIEADRLRRELTAAQDATARAEADARLWRERQQAEQRSHAATKGMLTKARKRAANGVCPCCHRSFAATRMAAHMATKHPDFDAAAVQ